MLRDKDCGYGRSCGYVVFTLFFEHVWIIADFFCHGVNPYTALNLIMSRRVTLVGARL